MYSYRLKFVCRRNNNKRAEKIKFRKLYCFDMIIAFTFPLVPTWFLESVQINIYYPLNLNINKIIFPPRNENGLFNVLFSSKIRLLII